VRPRELRADAVFTPRSSLAAAFPEGAIVAQYAQAQLPSYLYARFTTLLRVPRKVMTAQRMNEIAFFQRERIL